MRQVKKQTTNAERKRALHYLVPLLRRTELLLQHLEGRRQRLVLHLQTVDLLLSHLQTQQA